MKKLFLIVCLVALPATALADETVWVSDFDQAAKMAKESGKDLLVDFTGSDWCGWCIKLHDEVFAHEPFLNAARAKFVLVALDFPRSEAVKAKVPNPARNQELARKYAIRGYPTVLLMTADGTVYGRTGYKPGGPEAYVKHLDDLTEGRAKVLETVAHCDAFDECDPKARVAKLDEAIGKLTSMAGAPGSGRLCDSIEGVLVESTDAAVRKTALKALLGAKRVNARIFGAAVEIDPKNAEGVYESALLARCSAVSSVDDARSMVGEIAKWDAAGAFKDATAAFKLYLNAAFWSFHPKIMNDASAARPWLAKAKAVGTDDPKLRGAIERLEKQIGTDDEEEGGMGGGD